MGQSGYDGKPGMRGETGPSGQDGAPVIIYLDDFFVYFLYLSDNKKYLKGYSRTTGNSGISSAT